MKKIVTIVIVCALAWYAFTSYQRHKRYAEDASVVNSTPTARTFAETPAEPPESFTCDGRTHCSSMRSCEEATYFLRNCSGAEMDGDNDGIPCEKQWCGHR